MRQHWSLNEVGLAKAEEIVSIIKSNGIPARIDETWWDYGGGITWDTIITESQGQHTKGMTFQLLYPAEHERMNKGTFSDEDMKEVLSRVLK